MVNNSICLRRRPGLAKFTRKMLTPHPPDSGNLGWTVLSLISFLPIMSFLAKHEIDDLLERLLHARDALEDTECELQRNHREDHRALERRELGRPLCGR